jgi:hypothetical protein
VGISVEEINKEIILSKIITERDMLILELHQTIMKYQSDIQVLQNQLKELQDAKNQEQH